MVEFAILMIVFVPMVLWGFFISDAAYHQMEVQETVVSTTWDFSQRDQEGTSNCDVSPVQTANRNMYIDHSSAFDDPSKFGDTNDNKYFQPLAGRITWGQQAGSAYGDTSSASQVTCTLNPTGDLSQFTDWKAVGDIDTIINNASASTFENPGFDAMLIDHPFQDFANDTTVNKGGMVTCWAKAYVFNYMIPQKFMQEHAGEALTKLDKEANGTNVNTLSGNPATAVFLQDEAGLVYDTWAVQANPDIKYGDEHGDTFFKRVDFAELGTVAAMASFWTKLFAVDFMVDMVMDSYNDSVENLGVIPGLPPDVAIPGPYQGYDSNPLVTPTINMWADLGVLPDPLNVWMVARYQQGQPGGDVNCTLDPIDFGACDMGPTYESTPYKNFNSNSEYVQAYQKRGPYYMAEANPQSGKM